MCGCDFCCKKRKSFVPECNCAPCLKAAEADNDLKEKMSSPAYLIPNEIPDPEIAAMSAIVVILRDLEQAQQDRVLQWAMDRYGMGY